jgi:epoxyqueuosine reductase
MGGNRYRGTPRQRAVAAVLAVGRAVRLAGLAVLAGAGGHRPVLAAQWDNRRRVGPVAPDRRAVDPAGAAAEVREVARRAGAAVVGTTRLRDHHLYAGERCDLPHAISVAVVMDRGAMRTVPSEEATRAVMDAYRRVGRVAIAVAEHVRAAGWSARAATNLEKGSSEVLHVPVAIDAGLGQLGKHGSLITAEHGSNVRLATVLTDLPLAPDEPVDLGVDDFCATCRVCTTNCPPHAILDERRTVRGVEKWYVDFDACVPYFSDNGGCGICIEVCPWSEPGRGPLLSAGAGAAAARAGPGVSDRPSPTRRERRAGEAGCGDVSAGRTGPGP